jgi:hypothetical protein
MNVKTLDGNTSKWALSGHISKATITNKSEPHLKTRQLLIELFPTLQLLEEVPVPIRKSETLYLDFYLPLKKYCVEVHGEQHYKFVPFYHNNLLGFIKSKKRDNDKKEWCFLNGIKYIELPYNESVTEWKERVLNA